MLFYLLLQILGGMFILIPCVLLVVSLLKRKRKQVSVSGEVEADIAIVVTAFRETHYINGVITSILEQDYSNYVIYIVADDCGDWYPASTDSRVITLRPTEVLAGNVRSHRAAIAGFIRNHEYMTIIDSDNLVLPGYLKKLSGYFSRGYNAVQGIRVARNQNTEYARLDELSDIFYRFVDRQIQFEAGGSATLAGSGMGFRVSVYKEYLAEAKLAAYGFDKELQYVLVKNNHRIAFAEDLRVMDTKTAKRDEMISQRARWLHCWVIGAKLGLRLFLQSIRTFSFQKGIFAIYMFRPPLFALVLFLFTCTILNFFIEPQFNWLMIGFLLASTLLMITALIQAQAKQAMFRTIFGVPKFMLVLIRATLRRKGSKKWTISTTHHGVEESQL